VVENDSLISFSQTHMVPSSNLRRNSMLAEFKLGAPGPGPQEQGNSQFGSYSNAVNGTPKSKDVTLTIDPLSASVQTSVVYPNDPRLKIYKQIESS